MRVWDVLFNEGANILFRVALAIFKVQEWCLIFCCDGVVLMVH